jgi:hypothetical protein
LIFNYLLGSGMTETTCSPFGAVQSIGLLPFHPAVRSHNHLGNSFSIFNDKWGIRQINEQNFNFTTVIGINGSR